MNHSQNTNPFYNDKRLSNLDPERLTSLMAYAQELSSAPQDQKMNVFLSIQKRASQDQVSFSQEERNLLIQVLTEHMTPEEKKRVEIIQKLAAKLSSDPATQK